MESSRIAAIWRFADLPETDLEAIASVARELEIAPGTSLTAEGDFGHTLFAIESGTADVAIGGETVRTVGPGELVGETAVLSATRRSASVVATSPMRLIALFERDARALETKAPAAAERLREALDEHRALDEERAPES
jgi:CRP/FNR family transcriptional regulator, cyclic AMP receptor protein